MVGIPSFKNVVTIGYARAPLQAGLVDSTSRTSKPVVVDADAGSPDGTGRVVIETEPPRLMPSTSCWYGRATDCSAGRLTLRRSTASAARVPLGAISQIAAALEVAGPVVVDFDSFDPSCPSGSSCWHGPILKAA